MLLAIDSSAGTAVALVDAAGVVLAERVSHDPRAHAESIGPLLHAALRDAARAPGDITAVAYGSGPGPFTGLRVGIVAARTVAQALGVPVHAVLSPDAVAFAAQPSGAVVVVADAKRRERYWTTYAGVDAAGLPIRTGEPQVGAPDTVPQLAVLDAAPSAAALGRLAVARIALGSAEEDPRPRYLRAPDVTLGSPKRVSQ